jgi:hypothetical protein
MITLIWGLGGAGKSWLLSRILYWEWKQGSIINTINIPLTFSEKNENINKFWCLADTYTITNGIIAIDEAHKILDASQWSSLPLLFKDLICQQRHSGLDVYTICHSPQEIDVYVRRNVHDGYLCKSIFRFPFNERKKPWFQWIQVQHKARIIDETDRVVFKNDHRAKNYFLSLFWTKSLYDTYSQTRLTRYVSQTIFEKNKWQTYIVNRQLISSGRAKLRR